MFFKMITKITAAIWLEIACNYNLKGLNQVAYNFNRKLKYATNLYIIRNAF